MIGGIFSALMVGFLLESSNSYANVVADSYAQGGDEEFWESLSPEDQVKAKELIAKLRASKEGKAYDGVGNDVDGGVDGSLSSSQAKGDGSVGGAQIESNASGKDKVAVVEEKKKEAVSMFSDYDD